MDLIDGARGVHPHSWKLKLTPHIKAFIYSMIKSKIFVLKRLNATHLFVRLSVFFMMRQKIKSPQGFALLMAWEIESTRIIMLKIMLSVRGTFEWRNFFILHYKSPQEICFIYCKLLRVKKGHVKEEILDLLSWRYIDFNCSSLTWIIYFADLNKYPK